MLSPRQDLFGFAKKYSSVDLQMYELGIFKTLWYFEVIVASIDSLKQNPQVSLRIRPVQTLT